MNYELSAYITIIFCNKGTSKLKKSIFFRSGDMNGREKIFIVKNCMSLHQQAKSESFLNGEDPALYHEKITKNIVSKKTRYNKDLKKKDFDLLKDGVSLFKCHIKILL